MKYLRRKNTLYFISRFKYVSALGKDGAAFINYKNKRTKMDEYCWKYIPKVSSISLCRNVIRNHSLIYQNTIITIIRESQKFEFLELEVDIFKRIIFYLISIYFGQTENKDKNRWHTHFTLQYRVIDLINSL